MGQSISKNYLHITFSTKHRQPLIQPPYEAELHQYLGGTCNDLDCTPIQVGGFVDHVHILCLLSKKMTLVKLMEQLKANSSKWMKTKAISLSNFYWQDGYGAFSVNPSQVDKVIVYIQNQHQHHQRSASRRNIGRFLENIKWSMTSGTFGIKLLNI